MSGKYEMWRSDDSDWMWGLPRHTRLFELTEQSSRLILRFEAVDWETAKRVRHRFLFEDNPDGFVPLNIPAEQFLTEKLRCGLVRSDRLRAGANYTLISDHHIVGLWPEGTELEVMHGDADYPEWIYARVVPQCGKAPMEITKFAIHEADYLSGLMTRL